MFYFILIFLMLPDEPFQRKIQKSIQQTESSPIKTLYPSVPMIKINRDFFIEEILSDDFNVFSKGLISLDVDLLIDSEPLNEYPPDLFPKIKACIDYIEDTSDYTPERRARPLIVESMNSLILTLLKQNIEAAVDPILECEIPQSLIMKMPLNNPSEILFLLYDFNPDIILQIYSEEIISHIVSLMEKFIRQDDKLVHIINTLLPSVKAGGIPRRTMKIILHKITNIYHRSANHLNHSMASLCLDFLIAAQKHYTSRIVKLYEFSTFVKVLNNPDYNVEGKIFDFYRSFAESDETYIFLAEVPIFSLCASVVFNYREAVPHIKFFFGPLCRLVGTYLLHADDEKVLRSFMESEFPEFLHFIFENASAAPDLGDIMFLLEILQRNENLVPLLDTIDPSVLFTSILDSTQEETTKRLLDFLLIFETNDLSTPFLQQLANVVNDELFKDSLEDLIESENPTLSIPAETLYHRFYDE